MKDEAITFSFGENWNKFIEKHYNEDLIAINKNHILNFLQINSLKGKIFLDIGCGSGLSSIGALEAGANKVISFDIDPLSVETTNKIKELKGNPKNWIVLNGSILDHTFISTIDHADIIYSWGVLHHTGNMWKAIENAASLMNPEGLLYLALYTKTSKSEYWIKVKKKYNESTYVGKKIMEYIHVLRYLILPYLIKFKNPWKYMREYNQNRGMDYMTDIKDWLGGYPYEDAKIEEVFRFCRDKLKLELINIATGEANTEYLFKKINH